MSYVETGAGRPVLLVHGNFAGKSWWRELLKAPRPRTHTPPYLGELVDEVGMMHPANFSGNARLLSDWRMNGQLRSYTNPVLVTSGDRDTLVPPSSTEATARAFPQGAYTRIQNAGHSPRVEAPKRVRELLSILL